MPNVLGRRPPHRFIHTESRAKEKLMATRCSSSPAPTLRSTTRCAPNPTRGSNNRESLTPPHCLASPRNIKPLSQRMCPSTCNRACDDGKATPLSSRHPTIAIFILDIWEKRSRNEVLRVIKAWTPTARMETISVRDKIELELKKYGVALISREPRQFALY